MKVFCVAEVIFEFCLAVGVLSVGKRSWKTRDIFPQVTWNYDYNDGDNDDKTTHFMGDNDDETTLFVDDYDDDATHFTDDYDDDVTRSMEYLIRENNDLPYWITGTLFPCSDLDSCTYLIGGLDIVPREDTERTEEEERDKDGADSEGPQRVTTPLTAEARLGPVCLTEGQLDTTHNRHAILGVYRLRRTNARLYYHFEYPADQCCPRVGLYLDEQALRFRTPSAVNCSAREVLVDRRSPQSITLSPENPAAGCRRIGALISCRGGRLLQSDVIRRWHVAISNCAPSATGLRMRYTLLVYGLVGSCPFYGSNSAGTGNAENKLATVLSGLLLMASVEIVLKV